MRYNIHGTTLSLSIPKRFVQNEMVSNHLHKKIKAWPCSTAANNLKVPEHVAHDVTIAGIIAGSRRGERDEDFLMHYDQSRKLCFLCVLLCQAMCCHIHKIKL